MHEIFVDSRPERSVESLGTMADQRVPGLRKLIEPLRVPPGKKVVLGRHFDPGATAGWLEKADGEEHLRMTVEMLAEYQDRLSAQDTYAVLVVLQALDAGGKDGTIRHVMSGVNPQGVTVHSFKTPAAEELSHDFLWRYAKQLPVRGQIGIFNRSHYEEVLVVRVHPELLDHQKLPEASMRGDIWKRRYREINDWERYLVENGIRVVKLFLNISREEQRVRFLKRIDLPEKNWKFSAADVAERDHWDEYQQAFSDMLTHTSTEWAPWYVVPGDHKWFARIAVGAVLVHTLAEIDPHYPSVDDETKDALARAKRKLESEAPPGAAPDPVQEKLDARG
jgi:PPK2 family polyphosphate:nucleotide phosphotransferase